MRGKHRKLRIFPLMFLNGIRMPKALATPSVSVTVDASVNTCEWVW